MIRRLLGASMLAFGAVLLVYAGYQMFVVDLPKNEDSRQLRTLIISICLIYLGKKWMCLKRNDPP